MPTQTIFTDTPYGFKTLQVGSLSVFCGKVRFKGIRYTPARSYINVAYSNWNGSQYCTISFEVIDRSLANELYQVLGRLAKDIAQAKLDGKYGWVK